MIFHQCFGNHHTYIEKMMSLQNMNSPQIKKVLHQRQKKYIIIVHHYILIKMHRRKLHQPYIENRQQEPSKSSKSENQNENEKLSYVEKEKQGQNIGLTKRYNQMAINRFVGGLKEFCLTMQIPKRPGYFYVAFMAEIASGTSTIYEWNFDLVNFDLHDREFRMTYTYSSSKNQLVHFTSPLLCPYICYAQYFKALDSMDRVFIVTSTTFKNSIGSIKIINELKHVEMFLVRNKCDVFENEESFQKTVSKDKNLLKDWKINNIKKILYISARREDSFRDNAQFKRLMKGEFL